jgi:hypothetical protein
MNTPYVPPKNSSLDASAGVMAVAPFEGLTAAQRHDLRLAADAKSQAVRAARRAAEKSQS